MVELGGWTEPAFQPVVGAFVENFFGQWLYLVNVGAAQRDGRAVIGTASEER